MLPLRLPEEGDKGLSPRPMRSHCIGKQKPRSAEPPTLRGFLLEFVLTASFTGAIIDILKRRNLSTPPTAAFLSPGREKQALE